MRRFILAAAIAACLSPAPGFAAQRLPVPKAIDGGAKLKWVVKPDMLQISKLAGDHGVHQGHAVVECVINARGRPKDCVVTEEQGSGQGAFVSELAGRYQAASKDADGKPVEGRRVQFAFGTGPARDA